MESVALALLERAPWLGVLLGIGAFYHFWTKNRNAQAIDLADRTYKRMVEIESKCDRLSAELRERDAEIAYQQRVLSWTADYINQLHSYWTHSGRQPPKPRYPPPPEPASIKERLDRTHH